MKAKNKLTKEVQVSNKELFQGTKSQGRLKVCLKISQRGFHPDWCNIAIALFEGRPFAIEIPSNIDSILVAV